MRFFIAPHLAFLVQWLRVLGVDVRLWDKKKIFLSGEEAVVQWTPYPLPIEGTKAQIITLFSSSREALLKEFFEVTGVRPDISKMFKRCLRCNNPLIPLDPDEAKIKWSELPDYVYQTQKRFNWCEQCGQLFWAGTHVRNMIRILEEWGLIHLPPDEHKAFP
ncbi:MAG: Mut7-C RNAse domain-containing protein [Thermodesulfobacteriota bacterium]